MLYGMTSACVLMLTTFLVAEDRSVRAARARRARLYRAQVRWAEDQDRRAGREATVPPDPDRTWDDWDHPLEFDLRGATWR